MEVLNGHYDGKQVVIDEPVPADIAPDTPVKIVFERDRTETALDRLARLAGPGHGLPHDYAEQHEHYVKGTPRK
jgi:hypothetical protein